MTGQVDHRAEDVVGQLQGAVGQRGEGRGPPSAVWPQPRRGVSHRPQEDPRPTTVEGMGHVDWGMTPGETVAFEPELGEHRRRHPEGVDGRADIVNQPGDGELL